MKIRTIKQLYNFCDDIFLSHSNVEIVKFHDNMYVKIKAHIDDLIRLSQHKYLMKVLESAFKEYNILELTFGASFEKFTIILHMDLCFDI